MIRKPEDLPVRAAISLRMQGRRETANVLAVGELGATRHAWRVFYCPYAE